MRKWRGISGMSRSELAARCGLRQNEISSFERGTQKIPLEKVIKLSIALEGFIAKPSLRKPRVTPDLPRRSCALGELVNILLVEDNSDDVELTMHALQRVLVANRIRTVRDGAEALDFLFCRGRYLHRSAEELPQVVLLDLHLPKVSGMQVLREIKSHPLTCSIPVVILTTSGNSFDVMQSKQLGADAYIVKPVDLTSLGGVTPQLNFQWALLKAPATPGM